MHDIRRCPTLSNAQLNDLFSSAWPEYEPRDFAPILSRSLAYLGAFCELELAGFLNLAWDGGGHGFILDVTVRPSLRRQGLALAMLTEANRVAREHNLEWLHVDFEPRLAPLYRRAGYQPTEAGLLHIPTSRAL